MIGPLLLAYALATLLFGVGCAGLVHGWWPGISAMPALRTKTGARVPRWKVAALYAVVLLVWPVATIAGLVWIYRDDGEG